MMLPGVPKTAAPKVTHGRFKGAEKVFAGVEMRMQLTYRVDPREMISKRNLNRHMREVNKKVLKHWHEHMRPIHFTTKANSKYKYKKRTNTTVRIKKEAFGHNRPLRQKGVAESLTGNIKVLRATPSTGRLIMHGPWYLGQRVRRKAGGMSPDLKAELVSVDAIDALKLARLGSKMLAERFKQDKAAGLGKKVEKG